jgi:hypothetical protein
MINIDCTHVDVLLMPARPTALDLQVKLRIATAGDLIIQVGEQIEILFISEKGIVCMPLQQRGNVTAFRLKINGKEYLAVTQLFAIFQPLHRLVRAYLLVFAVFGQSHFVFDIRKFTSVETVVQRVLYANIHPLVAARRLQQGQVHLLVL